MQDYVEQRGGGYYLAGTRISLDSVVHAFQDGHSPEEIVRSFPMAGPLARICGAIAFYLENKHQVDAYLADQQRLWSELDIPTGHADPLTARLHAAKEHA